MTSADPNLRIVGNVGLLSVSPRSTALGFAVVASLSFMHVGRYRLPLLGAVLSHFRIASDCAGPVGRRQGTC